MFRKPPLTTLFLVCCPFDDTLPRFANRDACFMLPVAGMRASAGLRYTQPPAQLSPEMQQALDNIRTYRITPQWISGWDRFTFMHPRSGTIYYLSTTSAQWITIANTATAEGAPPGGLVLADLTVAEPWEPAGLHLLEPYQCELPDSSTEFPESRDVNPATRMYGQTFVWRDFVRRRYEREQAERRQAAARSRSLARPTLYQAPSIVGASFPTAVAERQNRQPYGPRSMAIEDPEMEADSPPQDDMLATVSVTGTGLSAVRQPDIDQQATMLRRSFEYTAQFGPAQGQGFALPRAPAPHALAARRPVGAVRGYASPPKAVALGSTSLVRSPRLPNPQSAADMYSARAAPLPSNLTPQFGSWCPSVELPDFGPPVLPLHPKERVLPSSLASFAMVAGLLPPPGQQPPPATTAAVPQLPPPVWPDPALTNFQVATTHPAAAAYPVASGLPAASAFPAAAALPAVSVLPVTAALPVASAFPIAVSFPVPPSNPVASTFPAAANFSAAAPPSR